MKLWLDDVRPPPRGWAWSKTVQDAIGKLQTGQFTEVSLDYDLDHTDGRRKGTEVMQWLSQAVIEGQVPMPLIHVHTANPVGASQFAWLWRSLEERMYGQSPAAANPDNRQTSLFDSEEEGFALVSPEGEGKRVQAPKGEQQSLFLPQKPDREAMERIRERELAERAARKGRRKKRNPLSVLKRRLMR